MTGTRALMPAVAAAAVAALLFMTVGIRGGLAFALHLRAEQLAALVTVGVATAVATVVFQTVTANRILTPSLIGLDALYVLVQTVLVFALGGAGVAGLPATMKFAVDAGVLTALAVALFLPLMRARTDLTLLLLAGVVLGVLFRSLSALLARLIDPNSFAVVQSLTFADFNTVNAALVGPCAGLTAVCAVFVWRWRDVLDIVALGPESATALGVDWRRWATGLLALVGLMTAASTALVGPVVFLGLLATALAGAAGAERHAVRLPLTVALSVLMLVTGQTVLSRILGNAVPLGVVIELAGGIVFILVVVRRAR